MYCFTSASEFQRVAVQKTLPAWRRKAIPRLPWALRACALVDGGEREWQHEAPGADAQACDGDHWHSVSLTDGRSAG